MHGMSIFKGNNHCIDSQVQAFTKARFCASFFFKRVIIITETI